MTRAYWTPANADRECNYAYCTKNNDFDIWNPNNENIEKPNKQGKRNDLQDCFKLKREGASTEDMMKTHPGSYIRYKQFIDMISNDIDIEHEMKKLTGEMEASPSEYGNMIYYQYWIKNQIHVKYTGT